MRYSFLLAILFISASSLAQRIENVQATVVDNKVIITYDVVGVPSGQRFKAQLYSSHNNFASPLFRVSGDVGEITPGTGKRIEWDATSELVTFSGEVTFEVRGRPVTIEVRAVEEKAIVWSFKNPPQSMRRGKNSMVEWTGGTPAENIKLELLRNGSVVQKLADSKNTGKQSVMLPKDLEKGVGYQIRVSSGNEGATSPSFEVKSKYPTWLKIAPLVVVGGVIAVVGGGGSGGGSGNLPTPPNPN